MVKQLIEGEGREIVGLSALYSLGMVGRVLQNKQISNKLTITKGIGGIFWTKIVTKTVAFAVNSQDLKYKYFPVIS